MSMDVLGVGGLAVSTNVVIPNPAPGTGRGVSVRLATKTGINLNAIAPTALFTMPATGFTKCDITEIYLENFSGASGGATASFGSSGTPNDFTAAAALTGGAVGKIVPVYAVGGSSNYGPGTTFVINVTVPQGVATTCDAEVWGWYD